MNAPPQLEPNTSHFAGKYFLVAELSKRGLATRVVFLQGAAK
jgi:hypothetical protein